MDKQGCAMAAFAAVLLGGAALVGIVKFMAWWNIANGACS